MIALTLPIAEFLFLSIEKCFVCLINLVDVFTNLSLMWSAIDRDRLKFIKYIFCVWELPLLLKGLIYKNLQNAAEGGMAPRPMVPIAVICCP